LSYSNQTTTKEIAWNGISFCVPSSWEIAQIGARHLILEDDSDSAMEVKWGPIKGRFSHQTHLKRLGALQTRRLRKTVEECVLPTKWKKALAGFQASGFSWQAETKSGRGVILYCPMCRNATLIQFFRSISTATEKIPLEVLRTFQDHREDGQTRWAVFDIRAVVPAYFKLVGYRFEPGNYELAFEHRGQKIFLYRWAPASILLGERNLKQFAKAISDFSTGDPVPVNLEGGQAVELSLSPRFKWLSRFKAKPCFHWLGLWHLKKKNRILGVKMQGKKPFDTLMLDRVCVGYESL
jgi:hypothetical protein